MYPECTQNVLDNICLAMNVLLVGLGEIHLLQFVHTHTMDEYIIIACNAWGASVCTTSFVTFLKLAFLSVHCILSLASHFGCPAIV